LAKAKRSGILIGTAGVYFTSAQLAAKGFHAAPTFGNAPNVDILVGSTDGGATICIQVKTAFKALRKRGRGDDKNPHHYEWDIGEKSARLNIPNLFFAFVDLKGAENEMPDVFIVPSIIIFKAFEKYLQSGKRARVRWHPKIETAEPYKNNWELIKKYLQSKLSDS
jgi:hypothetical protein